MRNIQVFGKFLILGLCLIVSTAFTQQVDRVDPGRFRTADMHPFVHDSRAKHEVRLDMHDGAEAADTNGVMWRLGVESGAVSGQPDAKDYRLTWTVKAGQVESVSVVISKFSLN